MAVAPCMQSFSPFRWFPSHFVQCFMFFDVFWSVLDPLLSLPEPPGGSRSLWSLPEPPGASWSLLEPPGAWGPSPWDVRVIGALLG